MVINKATEALHSLTRYGISLIKSFSDSESCPMEEIKIETEDLVFLNKMTLKIMGILITLEV